MIERLEPDPDLLVRHDGGSFVERATGFAAGCAKPRGNNDLPMPTSRLRQYPEQKNGPVTRSARLENRRRDGWPLPVCPEELRGGWSSATRHFRVWRKRSASGASFRGLRGLPEAIRSEEHTSELQSLMRNSYAVFCLK